MTFTQAQLPTFSSSSNGSTPSSGRLAALLRGLGSEAPQRGFRGTGTSPHACQPLKIHNPQHNSTIKQTGEKTMHTHKPQFKQSVLRIHPRIPKFFTTVILLGTLTACSSM